MDISCVSMPGLPDPSPFELNLTVPNGRAALALASFPHRRAGCLVPPPRLSS